MFALFKNKPFTPELRVALPPLLCTLKEVRQAVAARRGSLSQGPMRQDVMRALVLLGFSVANVSTGQLLWKRLLDQHRTESALQTWLDGLTTVLERMHQGLPDAAEVTPIADMDDAVLKSLDALGFRVDIPHDRVVWPATG